MKERSKAESRKISILLEVVICLLVTSTPVLGGEWKPSTLSSTPTLTVSINSNQRGFQSSLSKLGRNRFLLCTFMVFQSVFKWIAAASLNSNRVNPADYCVDSLGCKIAALDAESDEFKILRKYMKRSSTEEGLKIERIYAVDRSEERENIKKWEKYGNKMLLWHGTKPENVVGILQTGFRIAPAVAQLSGSDFGRGVYFTDMFSKAVKFTSIHLHSDEMADFSTWISKQEKKPRYLFVCEIALGGQQNLYHGDAVKGIPNENIQSVKGIGEYTPDPKGNLILQTGTIIPLGEIIKNEEPRINTATDKFGWTLRENEYVVYDATQIRIRYLVELF